MGKLITTNAEVVEALKELPAQMERFRAEVQAGFPQQQNGLALKGARAIEVSRQLVWGGPGRLMGWAFMPVGAGGTQVFGCLRDGRDSTAPILARFGTTNGGWGQPPVWFGPSGISVTDALWLDVWSGPGITGGGSSTPGTPTTGWTPATSLIGTIYIGAAD